MISIRLAVQSDIQAICAFDLIAHQENRRKEFIRRSVASDTCSVAVARGEVIGYGVLNYTFYDNGWIDMLYVHSDHRRRGVGTVKG